jgi:hypothetical protein
MKNKYNDDEYLDLHRILSEQSMGIEIFGNKKVSMESLTRILGDMGIKAGKAMCLLLDYAEWQSSLKR